MTLLGAFFLVKYLALVACAIHLLLFSNLPSGSPLLFAHYGYAEAPLVLAESFSWNEAFLFG
jgi:hypothetical protein